MLLISGLFSEKENACRKDYVFCPNCSVAGTTPTETPDDDTTAVTGTVSATPTETDEPEEPTETPTATTSGASASSDEFTESNDGLFFEIAKELNKRSGTPVPPTSLPTPVQPKANALANNGNWIGAIGDEQNSIIDSDGDGFIDDLEIRIGSDPRSAQSFPNKTTTELASRVSGKDSDYDGMSDQEEIASNTDPLSRDTDSDGCIDDLEIEAGTLPNDSNDRIDRGSDTDGDCVIDLLESKRTTNPNNVDTDGDRLQDGDEIAIGTDPFGKDTDGDGILDGAEVRIGSDPMIADYK